MGAAGLEDPGGLLVGLKGPQHLKVHTGWGGGGWVGLRVM